MTGPRSRRVRRAGPRSAGCRARRRGRPDRVRRARPGSRAASAVPGSRSRRPRSAARGNWTGCDGNHRRGPPRSRPARRDSCRPASPRAQENTAWLRSAPARPGRPAATVPVPAPPCRPATSPVPPRRSARAARPHAPGHAVSTRLPATCCDRAPAGRRDAGAPAAKVRRPTGPTSRRAGPSRAAAPGRDRCRGFRRARVRSCSSRRLDHAAVTQRPQCGEQLLDLCLGVRRRERAAQA